MNLGQVSHEHRLKIGCAARMPTCSGGQLTLRCTLLFLLSSNLSGGETCKVFPMISSFWCMSFARNLRGLLCATCYCHLTENDLSWSVQVQRGQSGGVVLYNVVLILMVLPTTTWMQGSLWTVLTMNGG